MSGQHRTPEQCTCGHVRGDHRVIGGQAICNVSPCGCMDFEAPTSNEQLSRLARSDQYLGKDRDPLREIILDRDEEIVQLSETLQDAREVNYESEVARIVAENKRLCAALERYGHHIHPNCHDLTLKEDGSFGPRNGCLCGFDAALSGESSPVETTGELEQLRRIDKAARVYVENRTHGNYSKMCDALFSAIPPEEPSERFPCPDCGGTGNRPELRAALKASAPVYNCPVTKVACIRGCAPARCAIAATP